MIKLSKCVNTNLMENGITVQKIGKKEKERILELSKKLNSNIPYNTLESRFEEMVGLDNFICFGFFINNVLIGISNAWISVHYYCGKRMEIDNFIIDNNYRSKGYGHLFIKKIEEYALGNEFQSVELNTYVENYMSHKYYFNMGYKILGFHFQKKLTT